MSEHPLQSRKIGALWPLSGLWVLGGRLMQIGSPLFYFLGFAVSIVSIAGAVSLLSEDFSRIFNSGERWSALRHSAKEIQIAFWAILVVIGIQTILSFHFWPVSYPVDVAVEANSKNYPDKLSMYGLIWAAGAYSELQVRLTNPSLYDYEGIEIRTQSAIPIYAMVQMTDVPNCSISPDEDLSKMTIYGDYVGGPRMSLRLRGVDGKIYEAPLNFESTPLPSILKGPDLRYRVRCDRFPKVSDLAFFAAVIDEHPESGKLPPPTPLVAVQIDYEVGGSSRSSASVFVCRGGPCVELPSLWTLLGFPILVFLFLLGGGILAANLPKRALA